MLARLHQEPGDKKAAAGCAGLAIVELERYGCNDEVEETIQYMKVIVKRHSV